VSFLYVFAGVLLSFTLNIQDMVFSYHKRLAVELLYHKANTLKPPSDEASTSQVSNGLQGTEGSFHLQGREGLLHSLNVAEDSIHNSADVPELDINKNKVATNGNKSGKNHLVLLLPS